MPRITSILILLPLLIVGIPAVRGDFTIAVGEDMARVSISATLTQNLSLTHPVYSFNFSPENSSFLQDSFNKAARTLSPSASIRDVSLTVRSVNQIIGGDFTLDLRYVVEGISRREGGVVSLNLAWRSLAVRDDLSYGGQSFNLIGEMFVEPIQELSVRRIGEGVPITTFFLNGVTTPPQLVQEEAKNLALLGFSFFSIPLDSWDRTFSPTSLTTTLQTSQGFNVTILQRFTEPGDQIRFTSGVIWYVLTASIVAEGMATTKGDTLVLDNSTFSTVIMSGIILASSGILCTVYLFERRITTARRGFRSKK